MTSLSLLAVTTVSLVQLTLNSSNYSLAGTTHLSRFESVIHWLPIILDISEQASRL